MNRFFLAVLAGLGVASAHARTALESAAMTETGSRVQTGKVQLLSAGGQAVIGAAQAGRTTLLAGFLYSLARHPLSGSTGANPPKASLVFPAGYCALPVGQVEVQGAVQGQDLDEWVLESAPGRNAASGFAQVAAGAGTVSGAIAAWNAGALSGWQTLRLTATADGGTSTTSADVYVGDPTTAFAGTLVWPEVAKRLVKPCK